MSTILIGLLLALWSFLGVFIWTGLHSDVKRWYKKIILLTLAGPIVWCFKAAFSLFKIADLFDVIYYRFEKWMKE